VSTTGIGVEDQFEPCGTIVILTGQVGYSRIKVMRTFKSLLLALAGLLAINPSIIGAQSSPSQAGTAQPAPQATQTTPPVRSASRYRPERFSKRAEEYYSLVWGVDSLSVKSAESGEMIRFSYRILDPAKAQQLNDKKAEPSLIDPQAGVRLVVPTMEKVGQLRQATTPEAGKSYWMAFSNKGRIVKKGDHVSVVIGKFHADGLVVD
jgi:hypothetical protein